MKISQNNTNLWLTYEQNINIRHIISITNTGDPGKIKWESR